MPTLSETLVLEPLRNHEGTHRHDIIWDRTCVVVNIYVPRQGEDIQEVTTSLRTSVSSVAAGLDGLWLTLDKNMILRMNRRLPG